MSSSFTKIFVAPLAIFSLWSPHLTASLNTIDPEELSLLELAVDELKTFANINFFPEIEEMLAAILDEVATTHDEKPYEQLMMCYDVIQDAYDDGIADEEIEEGKFTLLLTALTSYAAHHALNEGKLLSIQNVISNINIELSVDTTKSERTFLDGLVNLEHYTSTLIALRQQGRNA